MIFPSQGRSLSLDKGLLMGDPLLKHRLPAASISDYLFPTTAPEKEKAVKIKKSQPPCLSDV
jgi:hypothetical protein